MQIIYNKYITSLTDGATKTVYNRNKTFLVLHYIFHSRSCQISLSFFSWPGEKEYYEKQFETLQSFAEADASTAAGEIDEEEELFENRQEAHSELLMKISNYANIILLVFKVIKGLLIICYHVHFY